LSDEDHGEVIIGDIIAPAIEQEKTRKRNKSPMLRIFDDDANAFTTETV